MQLEARGKINWTLDITGQRHDGYFWYNCVDGSIRAVLELSDR